MADLDPEMPGGRQAITDRGRLDSDREAGVGEDLRADCWAALPQEPLVPLDPGLGGDSAGGCGIHAGARGSSSKR
jgi:hypothetical protein